VFDEKTVLGKTFSTASAHSSGVGSFFFWLDSKADFSLLEPGTVVAVQDSDDLCFASVSEIKENMDYSSPLEAFASHNFGDARYESKTNRFICQVVHAKILRWRSGAVKPVSGERKVHLASLEGVKFAFGIGRGVSAGFSTTPAGRLTKQSCLVKLPDEYLFGKEAQGINIGGQTGYAKTNLALNLALCALHDLDDVCVVGVNVKGEDLLWLDELNPELTSEDLSLWKGFGFDSLSWLNFVIFAPAGISLRKDGVPNDFKISWSDVKYDLNLLFSESREDENARNLVSHLASLSSITSFEDAILKLEDWMSLAEKARPVPGNHHLSTIQKVLRRLSNLSKKRFVNRNYRKSSFPDLLSVIKPKTFVTFDLNDALLTSTAQRVIFQKLLSILRESLESKALPEKTGVNRVVVFVDELSKYAHRSLGVESFLAGIKSGVRNIAERGRFAGLSLLGVEQYPSQIDDAVLENMSTRFFTRLKSKELSNEIYRYYAKDFLRSVPRLDKGVALLDHDTFPESLFVRFPRTLCATSKPKKKVDAKKLVIGVG
jgi:DNA helicase HerA-like ATPase